MRIVKVRVSTDVRVGEPGSSGSDGITGFCVRKVIDLAFMKNLIAFLSVFQSQC
jgi:hypothetical protein